MQFVRQILTTYVFHNSLVYRNVVSNLTGGIRLFGVFSLLLRIFGRRLSCQQRASHIQTFVNTSAGVVLPVGHTIPYNLQSALLLPLFPSCITVGQIYVNFSAVFRC